MIGKTIRRIRTEKGISQAELGNLVGTNCRTVSSWEVERTKPDVDMLSRIAKALNSSVAELFEEESAVTEKERDFVRKYRFLDKYGKKAVDALLEVEFERCYEGIQKVIEA